MLTLARSCSALFTLLLTTAPLLPAQTSPLEILEASYGAGNFQMNVAPKLRGMVQNNMLEVTADPSLLGGDPAPGSAKRLRVVYRFNGRQAEASAGDYERLRIPATNADWSAGAIPVNKTPAATSPGGFSVGDIWGTPAATTGLRIVSASYGAGTSSKDVREYLQSLVRDNALSVKVDNAAMGGDPAPARAKALEVTYEYRGATFQTSAKEGAYLALPDANARAATTAPADNNTLAPKLRILTARYGGDNRFNDVRDRVQGLVRDNAAAFKVENAAMGGDPAVGKDKSLELTYEWNGGVYSASAKEGKSLTLPEAGARPIAVAPPVAAAPVTTGRGPDSDASRSAGNRNVAVAPPVAGREITPIGTAGGLRIFYARYGAQGQEADVREQLRPLLQGDTLRATVGLAAMGGDPAPGVRKMLTVIYEYRGRTYEKAAYDGEALTLP